MPFIYYTYYSPVSDSIPAVASQEHLLGRQLLLNGLDKRYGIHFSLPEPEQALQIDANGKPFLPAHSRSIWCSRSWRITFCMAYFRHSSPPLHHRGLLQKPHVFPRSAGHTSCLHTSSIVQNTEIPGCSLLHKNGADSHDPDTLPWKMHKEPDSSLPLPAGDPEDISYYVLQSPIHKHQTVRTSSCPVFSDPDGRRMPPFPDGCEGHYPPPHGQYIPRHALHTTFRWHH